MSYRAVKRVIDVLVVLAGFGLLWWLMILIAVLIKISDRGKVFYSQVRIGRNRNPFRIYKFRTMVEDADEILFKNSDLYRQARSGSNKIKNDPRITSLGRLLRKYSLDELPQFFNVLHGEMSFVGPRAYRPDELEKYEREHPEDDQYLKALLLVKPGITGLWQVNGRSTVSFEERVRMEASYSKKISLLLDLTIILKTPLEVVRARGAS